jgi:alpha-glucosidase (family GH31 glycosyl hydrolase)
MGPGRTIRAYATAAAVAGAVLAVGAGATHAAADTPGTVTSGHARFEVLSPTLIRMEYAGDDTFTDAATFNAIGRETFTHTDFTTSTDGGWLTIATGKATLRYKVGSGPFTAQNVVLEVNGVTAAPAFGPATFICAQGTLCEAEQAQLSGVGVATDHSGFTGTGFAAGFQADGNALTYTLDVPADGTYDLQVRYANSTGGDNQNTTRILSATIDGGPPSTLTLPTTANWDTWALAKLGNVTLTAGKHTFVLARRPGDSGNVNVDSLALTGAGGAYPEAAPAPGTPCVFGTSCEGEDGALTGGARLATDHGGFTGRGFVAGLESATAKDTISLANVPRDGSYTLHLRYANGTGGPRTLSVDGTNQTLATTADWETWGTADIPVTLTQGDSSILLACTNASDSCRVNVDSLAFTAAGAPAPPAHTSLGGYRRGLDGVNGSAPVTPGLLYKDGWSLLDDTPSALYDPASRKLTPRPGHGFEAYQDDYLFAYGRDYKQALGDLATLTGPSELLPRWAYGTWYSEYYDRTADAYENTILPKFRADKVPLDVLVTDTDYKSPDVWDGWEIDTAKFPDPKGFFDWAQSEGLHNTMNIHPSILSSDPQYAQAQQTAQGKLTKNNASCYSDQGHGADCYTFDWGDPNQLKAYFDLHQTMERQGVDFWWLDWCCEQSSSSLSGVTPDAFINQQYADDADKTVGRGFAFSRAFGSLQAGGYSGPTGVPTGPWADKRTTVHFTGDTTSSWPTLAFEVGYTPGESAATGLSAVSHDIGGFNNDGTQTAGAEPGSTKEPDDLYARWVQLGTFQPVDRLHGNHSDRLPWQFGTAAKNSAEKFMNLRERLVPYTYTLAEEANRTGVPVVRATYLEYPDEAGAYDAAGKEYFYGPDVLVAPVTTPGTSTTTSVWFPPGRWTDYFTGKTYTGGSTQSVATTLDTMPVFIKAGGIMATRGADVANDVQHPLTSVALDVAAGANGHFDLFEDAGDNTDGASATTPIDYTQATPANGAPTRSRAPIPAGSPSVPGR